MPVFKDPSVGKNLQLWSEEATIQRIQWEQSIAKFFEKECHGQVQRVVTPHVFKRQLYDKYKDWFEDNGFRFIDDGDKDKKECLEMIPLGNKHLCHLAIFNNRPHSYKNLPMYYEVSEVYGPEGNKPGLYVTLFCEEGDEYIANLIPFISDSVKKLSKNIVSVDLKLSQGLLPDLVYTSKDDAKAPVFVYAMCIVFDWRENA